MKPYYLFDFDGTLVDSMPTFVAAMLRILDENNISYDDTLTKTVTPLGFNGTAAYMIDPLGLDMPLDQVIALLKEYMVDAYLTTIPAKSNVIPTLKELKSRGIRLSILTGSPHVTVDPCLKRLGIWDLFDHIWSCDDFGTIKADPQIYLQAAQRMGTTVDNVLFLDDNLHANQVAKSAGMAVCGVYDPSSNDSVEEMKACTDHYIYDFRELLCLE